MVKTAEKINFRIVKIISSRTFAKTFNLILSFLLGLLTANAQIAGSFTPFGLAFSAIVPLSPIGALGVCGVTVGYISQIKYPEQIRYLAAVLVIFGIRLFIRSFKSIKLLRSFEPLLAGFVCASAGIASTANGIQPIFALLSIAEGAICGVVTVFFRDVLNIVEAKKRLHTLSLRSFAAVVVSLTVILLSLSNFNLFSLSVGRILSAAIVLVACRLYHVAGGSVAGTIIGIIATLAGAPYFYAPLLSVSGIIAGLVSKKGQALSAFVYVIVFCLFSVMTGYANYHFVSEIVIGAIVFLIIPTRFYVFTNYFAFSQHVEVQKPTDKVGKLTDISNIFKELSENISFRKNAIPGISKRDISAVFTNASAACCGRCGLAGFCWQKEYDTVMEELSRISPILLNNAKVDSSDLPESFTKRCARSNEFVLAVNNQYEKVMAVYNAQLAKNESIDFIKEQYKSLSGIIGSISEDISKNNKFDREVEKKLFDYFDLLSVDVKTVECLIDADNRYNIEVRFAGLEKLSSSMEEIALFISTITGRKFEDCEISMIGSLCVLQCQEKESYTVNKVILNQAKDGEKISGDCTHCFETAAGKYIAVISDGMGSGEYAASESRFAVTYFEKLLQAGVSKETALKIINCALMLKTENEGFATIDIFVFDLYNAETEFLKLGANTGYIVRQGKVFAVEGSALPAGILPEANPTRITCKLAENDMIFLSSDGVFDENSSEILSEAINLYQNDIEKISQHVFDKVAKTNNGVKDDMSIIALQVCLR